MTLRHLRIFNCVCQFGSMTEAAKYLYISQPSISIAIKEMEEYYSVILFDRSARKISLTPGGKSILNYAQQIISLYDELDTSCKNLNQKQELRIGCGIDFGNLLITPIVSGFSHAHPDCLLRVTVNSSEITEPMIIENQLDLCIMEGTTHMRDLKHIQLLFAPIVAICHTSNPLAFKNTVTISDFKNENLLLREKHSPTRNAVNLYFESHNFNMTPVWECISAQALISAVQENIGVAFLPLDHVKMFPSKNIKILEIEDFTTPRYINIVYHKKKVFSPLMLEFIEYCHKYVRENLSEMIKQPQL